MSETKLKQWQFGSSKEWSVLQHTFFEARAFVGWLFSPKRRHPKSALLQLGSGLNPLPEFENVDFYFRHRGKARHVGHDLRRPLPYADDTFDGVFSEHTVEHLYPAEALALIAEVHRVLKPGGVFRCVVPNLARFVDFYNGQVPHEKFSQKFTSGCEAMWNLTQNDFHHSVWDAHMLKEKMLEAGFFKAEECSYKTGADPRLLVDLEWRAWESLYVEGVK
jgi:predicted SAM-dependent methyltransferase